MKQDIVIVIFGSTGDLTARKLLPAISKLYKNKHVSTKLKVLALGRKDFDTESYLTAMNDLTNVKLDLETLSSITEYQKMQITQKSDYDQLKTHLDQISHSKTKHVFYLAIGPEILIKTALQIKEAGLIKKGDLNQVLVFEKPFGTDLSSALEINDLLYQCVTEEQIFRIDHYLGKEMIQNIMTLRFANRIFDDIWDNKAIKSVKIAVYEKDGILNRAQYYDQAGALKDMVQSHLLQLLSLIAMDIPKEYTSKYIINEKIKVLKALSFDQNSLVFGQYLGYHDELHITKDSVTETFVSLNLRVNTKRFKGVPFQIITGKKLGVKKQFIEIEFNPTKEQEKWQLPLHPNKLILNFYPQDEVNLVLNSKEVGLKENIVPSTLKFDMASSVDGNIPEAYERLIRDIITGSKTLFTRWDEIKTAWEITEQIKDCQKELIIYASLDDLIKDEINV